MDKVRDIPIASGVKSKLFSKKFPNLRKYKLRPAVYSNVVAIIFYFSV